MLVGGGGDDAFVVLGYGTGIDYFDGGPGLDVILGGDGSDGFRVLSDFANLQSVEVIAGGGGVDRLLGTPGNDVFDFSAPGAPVLIDVERIETGDGHDTFVGTDNAEAAFGGAGFDILIGGGGDDTLSGGSGLTWFAMSAGDGHDRITDIGHGGFFWFDGFGVDDISVVQPAGGNMVIGASNEFGSAAATLEDPGALSYSIGAATEGTLVAVMPAQA